MTIKLMVTMEKVAEFLGNLATFILARSVVVNSSWSRIRNRADVNNMDSKARHQNIGSAEKDMVGFLYDETKSSMEHTDTKAQQLLTISIAVLSAFVVLGVPASNSSWEWLLKFGYCGLLFAVFLCLQILGVRKAMLPLIDADENEWTKALYECATFSQSTHRFIVDLYRAAWRWFILGFISLGIVYSSGIRSQSAESDFHIKKIVQESTVNVMQPSQVPSDTLKPIPSELEPANEPTDGIPTLKTK